MKRIIGSLLLAGSSLLCVANLSAATDTAQTPPNPTPYTQAPAAPPPSAAAPAAPTCSLCGTVEAVRYVTRRGEATGAGAILGGVAGGVVGHQFGQGRGNTAMTVLGAAGGAYAGHQVEKNIRRKSHWQVRVRLDTGRVRTVAYASQPGFQRGDRVKLMRGHLALLG